MPNSDPNRRPTDVCGASAEAYADVVDAMDNMVSAWKPLLCRAYHREFAAPFTVTPIGGSEIKQPE